MQLHDRLGQGCVPGSYRIHDIKMLLDTGSSSTGFSLLDGALEHFQRNLKSLDNHVKGSIVRTSRQGGMKFERQVERIVVLFNGPPCSDADLLKNLHVFVGYPFADQIDQTEFKSESGLPDFSR